MWNGMGAEGGFGWRKVNGNDVHAVLAHQIFKMWFLKKLIKFYIKMHAFCEDFCMIELCSSKVHFVDCQSFADVER